MSRGIVTRDRWGYQQRRSISTAPVQRTGLSLHYGAGPEWLGYNAPRGLQSVHFGRGFAAIGYTFVADLRGLLFYGRPLNLRGAHTYGHNTTWHAVCVPANSNTQPTEALIDALAWLLRHGLTRGWWEGLTLAPHYELSPTKCPGPLDVIADEVVRRARDGARARRPEEEDMVRTGDRGNNVAWWQWRLNEYLHGHRDPGDRGITVDGQFGPETERAVKDVQRKFAFEPTGEIDLSTAARLLHHLR